MLAGSFALSPEGRPSREAELSTIAPRSRVTAPCLVPTTPLPPFTTASNVCGGDAVGLGPQTLHVGLGQGEADPLDSGIAERAGDGRGERLKLRRQARLDEVRDVDVGIDLIDDVVRGGRADIGVLQQLCAGVRPVVRAEQQPVGPGREDPYHQQDRREHDQRVERPRSNALRTRGL